MNDYADDGQRFRLDSRIATGGMGEVWRATDTLLGREVAVKLLKTELADDPTFRARFETEARNAAALHHPGIAAVFDVGERSAADGSAHPRPFLVMELVDGSPLSELVGAGRELDPEVVRDLLGQVGEALGAAHRAGIVHRDVKPANLIVTPAGKVKVTDFGIARAADAVAVTRTGAVMGTPQYLSPEQAEGRPATAASDVYALGVVAFECLTGRRPFDAETPVATALAHLREPVPALPAAVPADLARVVTRALSKAPADRFDDGAAFAAALRDPGSVRPAPVVVPPSTAAVTQTQVLGAVTPEPEPEPVVIPQAAPADRRRGNGGLIAAAVVLLVALAVVLTLLLTGGDDEGDLASDTETSTPPSSGPASPTQEETTEDSPSEEPTEEEPTEEEPEIINLNPGEFIGRDVEEVEADLEGLDLNVERNEEANDGQGAEGQVTGVNPSGAVEPGDVITVTYWGPAPEPEPEPEPSETESTDPGLPLPTDGAEDEQ